MKTRSSRLAPRSAAPFIVLTAAVICVSPRTARAQTPPPASPFSGGLNAATRPLTNAEAQALRDAIRFKAGSFGFNFGISEKRGFYFKTGDTASDEAAEAAEHRKEVADIEKGRKPASPLAQAERLLLLARAL